MKSPQTLLWPEDARSCLLLLSPQRAALLQTVPTCFGSQTSTQNSPTSIQGRMYLKSGSKDKAGYHQNMQIESCITRKLDSFSAWVWDRSKPIKGCVSKGPYLVYCTGKLSGIHGFQLLSMHRCGGPHDIAETASDRQ